jgi:hypothetical protein
METFGLVQPQPKMTKNEVESQLEENGQKIMSVLHQLHAHSNKMIDNNGQRIDKTVKRLYNSVNARLRQNSAKLANVGQSLLTHVDSHLAQNQALISSATSNPSIADWYKDYRGIPDYTPQTPEPYPFPIHTPPDQTQQTNGVNTGAGAPPGSFPGANLDLPYGGSGSQGVAGAGNTPPTVSTAGQNYHIYRTDFVVNGKLGGVAVPESAMPGGFGVWQPPAGYYYVTSRFIDDDQVYDVLQMELSHYLSAHPELLQ